MTPLPLNLALSPYHLTTAEPSALVALLLGTHIVTMMPTPFGFTGGEPGREQVRDAVERSPAYLRLMESWRWSAPLWQAGVIGSVATDQPDPQDVGDDVQRIWQRIIFPSAPTPGTPAPTDRTRTTTPDRLAPLRPVMRPTLYRDQREYLDLVCADLLKGGPDPGISVVVTAGLDAFSVRHGLTAVRAGAAASSAGPGRAVPGGSVWQRAESALCKRLFAVGIPVFLRASGRRILAARARFEPELAELRAAITSITTTPAAPDAPDDPAPIIQRITDAAAAYSRAYAASRDDLATGDDDQGNRIQDGFISLTGVAMPADAALRSSLTAVRSLAARTGSRPPATTAQSGAPLDGPEGATLLGLIVKRMNIRPEGVSVAAGPAAASRAG